jgi:hypothetical protein
VSRPSVYYEWGGPGRFCLSVGSLAFLICIFPLLFTVTLSKICWGGGGPPPPPPHLLPPKYLLFPGLANTNLLIRDVKKTISRDFQPSDFCKKNYSWAHASQRPSSWPNTCLVLPNARVHSFGHFLTKKREISPILGLKKCVLLLWSSFGQFCQKYVLFLKVRDIPLF